MSVNEAEEFDFVCLSTMGVSIAWFEWFHVASPVTKNTKKH